MGALEWPRDITMYESTDVRWFVRFARVWYTRCVCDLAMLAVVRSPFLDGLRDVGRGVSELPYQVVSDVQATVQHFELLVGGHSVEEAR